MFREEGMLLARIAWVLIREECRLFALLVAEIWRAGQGEEEDDIKMHQR